MHIRKILVVGAGTMGRGIAQAAAQSGVEVLLSDVSREIAAGALSRIDKTLQRAVDKGELTAAEKTATVSRITPVQGLDEAPQAQLVIEAIREDIQDKRNAFAALDRLCPPPAVLATNTSALSVSEIATAAQHPERVVGMHFFNPAPRMPLIEVVRGRRTSDACVAEATAFAVKLGKTPIEVRESPGFVVNRLLLPMINEAIQLLSDGVASREAIDAGMTLGAMHPMGPLVLADFVGLDVCVSILETLERELRDPKYRPSPLLKRMVAEGKLGKKSGAGFYSYEK